MGPKIGCIILFTGTWAYDLTGGGGGGVRRVGRGISGSYLTLLKVR